MVSPPKKRSRANEENGYYWEKRLSDSQESLLRIHKITNWKDVALTQEYKTPKGIMKEILWKIPSTKEKKVTCGKFKTLGCFNLFNHPNNQALIQHTKLSCFRSACEYCWLEKWLDESVDERRLIRHQLSILLEKSEFLGALITDLENMKKTLS